MRMYDIIVKKRNGHELTRADIQYFIDNYTKDNIPDYQASALLMAIYFQGMTETELGHLTLAMAESGERIDLSEISGIKVDKHSTGGVGDKTTLVLVPLVASLGIPVPKMSGRGLGHTGGTLDKLLAIPGIQLQLSREQFIKTVNQNNLAVIGQTETLAPADQKLYHLRDVTATVHSIPLIASSIMSKKIAAGADAIVLDVKTGSGAFMNHLDDALELAQSMVAIGHQVGKETVAIISDMNQPLGHAIGNSLEMIEAIETLKGNGPKDLTELCLTIGSYMVVLAGKAKDESSARTLLEDSLQSGKALEYFRKLIEGQQGDPGIVEDYTRFPQAKYTIDLLSKQTGYIHSIQAEEIGMAAMMLGAGRRTIDAKIDLSVGIVLHRKICDYVNEGDSLLTIYANTRSIDPIKEKLLNSIHINADETADLPKLIYDIVSNH